MAEREKPKTTKRMSWITKFPSNSKEKDSQSPLSSAFEDPTSPAAAPSVQSPVCGLALSSGRSIGTSPSLPQSADIQDPDRPTASRRTSSSSLSKQELDTQASNIILNALERTNSAPPQDQPTPRSSGSFSKMSFSSMMGGLTALSLTRSNDDKERGRSRQKDKDKPRSSSVTAQQAQDDADTSLSRTRSMSPFRLGRRTSRARDPSPSVEALRLSQSDVDSDTEPCKAIRPRNAFSQSPMSDDESDDEGNRDDDSEEESWSENDQFDSLTEQNTEHNAQVPAAYMEPDGVDAPDPLGEGVNIIVPSEPYFPTTSLRNPRRKKSMKHETLSVSTSRPVFQRDRCTITLTQGDPAKALEQNGRRSRRYVVASDLSDESRYALEWAVGTVLRDGDNMIILSVNETDSKIDPLKLDSIDRVSKIRNQQERQTLAYILLRQVTTLLQRTKLNVTVACQAWHAKNARHMLLDIIDHAEPTMLIVGSRGLGKLNGILLGSTSHYLVQKCSVPVMVARRRLKRPAKRSAHLSKHRARVSLAEAAGVERITPKVDKDVEQMRNELEREEERREDQVVNEEDEADTEVEASGPVGRKVRGD
ncbi:hypothetical protein BD410DRAFT_789006 [Rickenella mellea]|uniref:UspA domain-containing protein n=1 Tax=Rickenella mellea TaxID=50990 RepID=A0A4Y7Q3P2_9AGAM|nr:hypothetical protein BD410DRAFT_789006 [Rickenella mellea]